MTVISIDITDERLHQLQQRANGLGVTPDILVRVSIEELLTRDDRELQEAIAYILEKNADLYRRLA